MPSPQVYLSDRHLADRFLHRPPDHLGLAPKGPDLSEADPAFPGCTRWKLAEIEAWEAAKAGEAA